MFSGACSLKATSQAFGHAGHTHAMYRDAAGESAGPAALLTANEEAGKAGDLSAAYGSRVAGPIEFVQEPARGPTQRGVLLHEQAQLDVACAARALEERRKLFVAESGLAEVRVELVLVGFLHGTMCVAG